PVRHLRADSQPPSAGTIRAALAPDGSRDARAGGVARRAREALGDPRGLVPALDALPRDRFLRARSAAALFDRDLAAVGPEPNPRAASRLARRPRRRGTRSGRRGGLIFLSA